MTFAPPNPDHAHEPPAIYSLELVRTILDSHANHIADHIGSFRVLIETIMAQNARIVAMETVLNGLNDAARKVMESRTAQAPAEPVTPAPEVIHPGQYL